jgi:hypothetical protein
MNEWIWLYRCVVVVAFIRFLRNEIRHLIWPFSLCVCPSSSQRFNLLDDFNETCTIYGQNVASEGTVTQWYKMFRDDRKNVHDEERSFLPAFYSEWWSCSKWKTALHNFRTFVWIYENFTRSFLWDCHRLSYHKFRTRLFPWVRKIFTVSYKTQKTASALNFFLRAIPHRWRWISQSHRTSNRWWNLSIICECWNQRSVKAVDAHTFAKQAEKFKQTLSACQKADGNCFLGQESCATGGIYVTRDHNSVRS